MSISAVNSLNKSNMPSPKGKKRCVYIYGYSDYFVSKLICMESEILINIKTSYIVGYWMGLPLSWCLSVPIYLGTSVPSFS